MLAKTKTVAKQVIRHTATARKHATRLLKTTTRTRKHAAKQLTKNRRHRTASRHALRTAIIMIATLATGSVAYGISMTKPVITVTVAGGGPAGRVIIGPSTPTPAPAKAPGDPDQVGKASWYALGLAAPDALTCASTTFPRGTYLNVKNLRNGRTVTCLVNDYGPEAWTGRVIDLSRGSFTAIDDLSAGVTMVEIRVVSDTGGFKLPININIGSMVGYSLCRQSHDIGFCYDHRKDTKY